MLQQILKLKGTQELSKSKQQYINGGVQGACNGYCVPKKFYTATCINGWCHYTPIGL